MLKSKVREVVREAIVSVADNDQVAQVALQSSVTLQVTLDR